MSKSWHNLFCGSFILFVCKSDRVWQWYTYSNEETISKIQVRKKVNHRQVNKTWNCNRCNLLGLRTLKRFFFLQFWYKRRIFAAFSVLPCHKCCQHRGIYFVQCNEYLCDNMYSILNYKDNIRCMFYYWIMLCLSYVDFIFLHHFILWYFVYSLHNGIWFPY